MCVMRAINLRAPKRNILPRASAPSTPIAAMPLPKVMRKREEAMKAWARQLKGQHAVEQINDLLLATQLEMHPEQWALVAAYEP